MVRVSAVCKREVGRMEISHPDGEQMHLRVSKKSFDASECVPSLKLNVRMKKKTLERKKDN